jgi:mevalonate kinase
MESSLSLSIKRTQEVLDAKRNEYEAESKKLLRQDGADYEKTKIYTEQLLEEIQGLEQELRKLNQQKDSQALTELLTILRPHYGEISAQVLVSLLIIVLYKFWFFHSLGHGK